MLESDALFNPFLYFDPEQLRPNISITRTTNGHYEANLDIELL